MSIVNESEQVAAKAAEVRTGDGNGGICCIAASTAFPLLKITSGTGSELVG